MLSEQTINTIKATVPVLEVHGTAITKRFYELLFTNHPELLNVFNHANQRQGKQQAALANAVYAAALHIDKLETILPAVKQIAHKHRSLGIKPEQYPIVGRHLLAAIREVLGDAAAPEILDAWAEAYQVIANVFIEVEASLYEQAERQAGGWEGFRAFVVDRKVKESDTIASFYLVPRDGGQLAGFEPGQYVSVRMQLPGEQYTHIRQYSLSDSPGKNYYRITVKREDGAPDRQAGKVSTALHEQVGEGDILWLSAPAGDFVLRREDQRPVVLISGGVGLTPMISMVNTLAETEPERPVTFIHAAANGQVHAMREHVAKLASECAQVSAYFCYSSPTGQDREAGLYHREGRIETSWLAGILPSSAASYYLCGPQPFMAEAYKALQQLGVSSADIHFEFFGPKGSLEEEREVTV